MCMLRESSGKPAMVIYLQRALTLLFSHNTTQHNKHNFSIDTIWGGEECSVYRNSLSILFGSDRYLRAGCLFKWYPLYHNPTHFRSRQDFHQGESLHAILSLWLSSPPPPSLSLSPAHQNCNSSNRVVGPLQLQEDASTNPLGCKTLNIHWQSSLKWCFPLYWYNSLAWLHMKRKTGMQSVSMSTREMVRSLFSSPVANFSLL